MSRGEASPVRNVEKSRRWLIVLVVTWAAILAAYAITRHERLNSAAYDLAIQSQVIWNTSQGDLFASSIEVTNYLGDHVQPILLLLVPLYWLVPDVRALLVLQALVLCLAAVPLFHLAYHQSRNPKLALVVAGCYLLYPATGFINRFDFHLITLCIPLLAYAVLAIETERWRQASLLLLLALFCKEEIGLTVCALGLYVAVGKRQPLGLVWAAVGLFWSLFALLVVIPAFREASSDTVGRYLWLGDDLPSMVQTLITRPGMVITDHLADPLRLRFLLKLLLPTAFIALLSPVSLLICLPCLAYNLLSDTPSQSSIYFHYVSPIIPILFSGTIKGTVRILGRLPRSTPLVFGALLIGTAGAWVLDNPFTTTIEEPFQPVYGLEEQPGRAAFAEASALVPEGASLSTMMAYAPHFTTRPGLYLFYHTGRLKDHPYGFPPADQILLNLSDQRWWVNPRLFATMVETAIGLMGYDALYFQDDVVLLSRESTPREATGALVQRVAELHEAHKFAPTSQGAIDRIVSQWRLESLPPEANTLRVDFRDGPTLLGYRVRPERPTPRGALCVTLYWQEEGPSAVPLTAFVHLMGEGGVLLSQRDSMPVLNLYPTTSWQGPAVVADMHCLQVPSELSNGSLRLAAGLYVSSTRERLEIVSGSDQTEKDAALLSPQAPE